MPTLKWLKSEWNYYYFNDAPTHISSITLNTNSIALTEVWQTYQLTATVSPNTAVETHVFWHSSDESVAYVDSNWLVTCVTPGSCTITASCDWISATCNVIIAKYINYIVVWWGWWWGWADSCYDHNWWWWGWGWQVISWTNQLNASSYNIVIWSWWAWWTWWKNFSNDWVNWWWTCISWLVTANWWWWWYAWTWVNQWAWWNSWSWCSWWTWWWGRVWWWWWWTCWNWWNWVPDAWWNWWVWLFWYWWWGWWWWRCSCTNINYYNSYWLWNSWWWHWAANAWAFYCYACPAVNCWWGWGWWMQWRPDWAAWWAWIAIICYKSDWSCWFTCATWWTVTTNWDYKVHTFTSNWTFTIVS